MKAIFLFLAATLANLLLWGIVIYVGYHFISKYW
jgi:hypothetical protein